MLRFKQGEVSFADPAESIASVAKRMAELGFSQMPVRNANGSCNYMVHELDLLRALANGTCRADENVMLAAAALQGQVAPDDSLSKVQLIFDDNNIAVVFENHEVVGIITKIDVVEFLAARS